METNYKDSENKKKILLVEDDNALADVYLNRLTSEGFDVRRVDNGEAARAAAVRRHHRDHGDDLGDARLTTSSARRAYTRLFLSSSFLGRDFHVRCSVQVP